MVRRTAMERRLRFFFTMFSTGDNIEPTIVSMIMIQVYKDNEIHKTKIDRHHNIIQICKRYVGPNNIPLM